MLGVRVRAGCECNNANLISNLVDVSCEIMRMQIVMVRMQIVNAKGTIAYTTPEHVKKLWLSWL